MVLGQKRKPCMESTEPTEGLQVVRSCRRGAVMECGRSPRASVRGKLRILDGEQVRRLRVLHVGLGTCRHRHGGRRTLNKRKEFLVSRPRLRLPQRRAGRRRKLDWIRIDMVGTGLPVPLVTRLATRPCRMLCPLIGLGPALPQILTITFNAVLSSIAAYPSGTPRRPTVMSKTGDGSSVPARTSSISSSM